LKNNRIERFITFIQSSLDTHSAGASARKLTAFWITMLLSIVEISWLWYAIKKDDFGLLVEVLIANMTYGASLLGLTTWQSVKETNKKEKTDENNESPAI
jgi:hypothetical protein